MIKKCPYCGEYYDGYAYNVTCGREECQTQRHRIVNRTWWHNKQPRKKVKKLSKDANEAKKCGESYGYYKEVLSPEARIYWDKFDKHVKERIKEYEAARTENRPAASSY